ncbi:hypothetical protein SDC9_177603 [bioreactor metagenome]|uniref:Uncharacterized protein n=1 Tax=bioreactor metagenome TaxID=1076179 RepID=A0A645GTR5_9ZZZZ
MEFAFLARGTLLALAGSAVGAGGETRIAAAAGAALGGHVFGAVGVEVNQHLAGIKIGHHGADRHFEENVVGFASVLILAAAVGAAGRGIMALVKKIGKALLVQSGAQDDTAAASAVAAVRPAFGHELLASETAATVAAVAGFHRYAHFIHKHAPPPFDKKTRGACPRVRTCLE